MRPKIKLDWDTVELVGPIVATQREQSEPPAQRDQLLLDQRGRSTVKKILSGAAMKARAEGVIYTHVELRQRLPVGLETLVYAWNLVAAAVDGDPHLARGVISAVRAMREASDRLARRTTPR